MPTEYFIRIFLLGRAEEDARKTGIESTSDHEIEPTIPVIELTSF